MKIMNNALRILRLYYGISQAELAQKLDVSQSLISEIERENKAVSINLLEKYSTALNIKMSQLLFFAEEMEGAPPATRGKLFIAGKTLSLLEKIAPAEPTNVTP